MDFACFGEALFELVGASRDSVLDSLRPLVGPPVFTPLLVQINGRHQQMFQNTHSC